MCSGYVYFFIIVEITTCIFQEYINRSLSIQYTNLSVLVLCKYSDVHTVPESVVRAVRLSEELLMISLSYFLQWILEKRNKNQSTECTYNIVDTPVTYSPANNTMKLGSQMSERQPGCYHPWLIGSGFGGSLCNLCFDWCFLCRKINSDLSIGGIDKSWKINTREPTWENPCSNGLWSRKTRTCCVGKTMHRQMFNLLSFWGDL